MKAMANESRWRIVGELIGGPLDAGDMSVRLKLSRPIVMHGIRVLRRAGIVETAKEGGSVWYKIAENVQLTHDGNALVLDFGCCTFRFVAAG